jgi:hypothetical protein
MRGEYLKAPTVERLSSLLEQLCAGALQIPPFQRSFEWDTAQRLHLLDTVRQGIPCGSVMLWRTRRRLPLRRALGPFAIPASEPDEGQLHTYLLDGQQRLTTLLATLGRALWTRAEQPVPFLPDAPGRFAPDGGPWELHFSLSKDDFVAPLPGADPDPDEEEGPLLPLSCLLDDTAFDEWREGKPLDRTQLRVARDLQRAFRDYPVPTVPLVTEDMDIVQRTFKRVNDGGTRMEAVHLARALTWEEGFDLTEELRRVGDGLDAEGWAQVPEDLLLKVVAGLAGQEPFSPNIEDVAAAIKRRRGQPDDLLLLALHGASETARLLRQLHICGPYALPYSYAFVFLAELLGERGRALDADDAERVLGWLLVQMHTERLGQSPHHVMRAMRKELRELARGTPPRRPKGKKGKKVPPVGRFNLAWGRSRLAALALVAAQPLDMDGVPLDAGPLLAQGRSEVLLQLLQPRMDGASPRLAEALRSPTVADELRGVANRVLLRPAELADLRAGVLGQRRLSVGVLSSHLIPEDMTARLQNGEVSAFLRAREALILDRQRQQLKRFGVGPDVLTLTGRS